MAEQKKSFGRYQVKKLLGEGGMGRVWLAHDPNLEVSVAIKELKEQYHDEKNQERFFREAQIAARCHHHNIVLIKDLCKDPPYFVMEFLQAEELTAYTKPTVKNGKPITLDRLVYILKQVCDGLGFLHEKGIAHRDLKPANVMLLLNHTVKLTDFGISKAPFGQRTQTQVVMGTVPYMSPEQLTRPLEVDSRTDLWALGVVLYELVQRSRPFPGEGGPDTILAIAHNDPLEPQDLPPTVDQQLRAILRKALCKDVGARYQSAAEFKQALVELAAGTADASGVSFPYVQATMEISADPTIAANVKADCQALASEIARMVEMNAEIIDTSERGRAEEQLKVAAVHIEEGNIPPLLAAMHDLTTLKADLERGIIQGIHGVLASAQDEFLAGEHIKAARLFRRVLEVLPDRIEAQQGFNQAIEGAIESGRLKVEEDDDLQGAIAVWKAVLEIQDGNVEARRLVEAALVEAEKRTAAEEHLEAARSALEKEDPRAALQAVEEVLKQDPENEEALEIRVTATDLLKGKETEQEVNEARQAAQKAFGEEDLPASRKHWERVLSLLPGDREAKDAIAEIDRRLAAIATEERAATLRSSAGEAFQAGRYEDAQRDYRGVLELLPGDEEASARLEEIPRLIEERKARAAQEEHERKARPLQESLAAERDALSAELGQAEEYLDAGQVSRAQDVLLMSSRGLSSTDLQELESARGEVSKQREELRGALSAVAKAAFEEVRPAVELIEAVPREDHSVIDGQLMSKAVALAGRLRECQKKGEVQGLLQGREDLGRLAGQVRKARQETLQKLRKEAEEAGGSLKKVWEQHKEGLRERSSMERKVRDELAASGKLARAEALAPLQAHVKALSTLGSQIQKASTEHLSQLRAGVGQAWAPVAERGKSNRRSLNRDAALKRRFDDLQKRVQAAGSARAAAELQRLHEEIRGLSIPFDRMRAVPAALGIVIVAALTGGYLGYQWWLDHRRHTFQLTLEPWGRVVKMESSDAAEPAPDAPGEGAFHDLELVRGTWEISVKNEGMEEPQSFSITIPDDLSRVVQLGAPDYEKGLREFMAEDPFFKPPEE